MCPHHTRCALNVAVSHWQEVNLATVGWLWQRIVSQLRPLNHNTCNFTIKGRHLKGEIEGSGSSQIVGWAALWLPTLGGWHRTMHHPPSCQQWVEGSKEFLCCSSGCPVLDGVPYCETQENQAAFVIGRMYLRNNAAWF